MVRQYRAPTADGAVLAEPSFDALPALVEANRRSLDRTGVTVGGLPLRELRARARREALELAREYTEGPAFRAGPSAEGPLLLAGHQPELSHPGVWVKNFALNGLARKLDGTPLNLVVDNDTLKSTALRFPTFRRGDPASVRLESLTFDTFSGEVPYEDRGTEDAERACAFDSFARRAEPLWSNWGYEPLLRRVWPDAVHHKPTATIGERFAVMRRDRERAWGCHNLELPVSRLSQTDAFGRFASHVLADLPRFRSAYNAAIRAYRAANDVRSANHPAPELADGEAPFWVRTAKGRRGRATAASDVKRLRPRALTLTLFARLCLGDFFIHGIGGGKYDEVTDAIVRDYFGVEPPAYQVLSATIHLPLPAFPSTADDLRRAGRRLRDLRWNPQHRLPPERRDAGVKALVDTHAALAANEPPYANHAARRERFRALQRVKERLRALVADQVPGAEAELRRVRSEVGANAILRRRDYAWVLYPEEPLRGFLQRFL
ncbi:MAG: hypothetical protein J0I06_07580 [Planctomycetes bacterium]|nr:hypothetical protein [Planctomycetota bacterium]